MSKYSYSLDVGEDLEADMPDSEVSVPKGLEKYEKEFKELVDDKPEKKVKAEEVKISPKPAKETRKEVKKEEPKMKQVKKEEKKEIKEAKKADKPVQKVEKPAVQKSEPKVERPKADKPEPTMNNQPERNSRWTIPILLALVLLAAVIYIVQGMQTETPNGDYCTLSYINDQNGLALDYQHASEAQKYWLKKAYNTKLEAEAAEIVHMLGCKKAEISEKADPAAYADCKTPAIYVVISDAAVQAVKATAKADSVITALANKNSKPRFFKLAYATENPKILSWRVVG